MHTQKNLKDIKDVAQPLKVKDVTFFMFLKHLFYKHQHFKG
jgi:hypothetical protein